MTETCAACRHWQRKNPAMQPTLDGLRESANAGDAVAMAFILAARRGTCRYNAPPWPETDEADWCGKFEQSN